MKKQIDAAMILANSHSRSDFCREAVSFYIGYLNHKSTVDYLSPLLVSILKSDPAGTDDRGGQGQNRRREGADVRICAA